MIQTAKTPCYNCEDRYPGCHDRCEAYLAVKSKRDELHIKMQEHNMLTMHIPGRIKRSTSPILRTHKK